MPNADRGSITRGRSLAAALVLLVGQLYWGVVLVRSVLYVRPASEWCP